MKHLMEKVFLSCAMLVMMTACASGRHMASAEHYSQKADSSFTASADSILKVMVVSDSVSNARTEEYRMAASAAETDTCSEITTEHIVESTDAAGNKTTTTDRTTRRHYTRQKQTSWSDQSNTTEEQTELYLSMLDSIAESRGLHASTSHEMADSATREQSPAAISPTKNTFSLSALVEAILLVMIIVGIDLLAARIYYRLHNNKK